jgi:hypothetical protein
MSHERAEVAVRARHESLERTLIDEFVRSKGYDPGRLDELTADVRDALLKDASVYASARLAEVESRSHFVHEIHDGGPDVSKTGLE